MRAAKWCAALSLVGLGVSSGVPADPPKEVMNIWRREDVKFVPSPIVPGAANAVISGDPKVPGQPYVVRNRFSPGTFSPPHFHPETRYIVHHPNQIHWDGAKDEEVIVQIMGIGPSATVRVDEAGKPKQ